VKAQGTDSSTCIPNSELRAVVRSNEEGKIAKRLVDTLERKATLLKNNVDLLRSVIVSKDSTIADQGQQVQILLQVKRNHENIIANKDQEIAIHKTEVKRQRRKKIFAYFLGAVGTGGAIYIFARK
jgi:hypothetical protein